MCKSQKTVHFWGIYPENMYDDNYRIEVPYHTIYNMRMFHNRSHAPWSAIRVQNIKSPPHKVFYLFLINLKAVNPELNLLAGST